MIIDCFPFLNELDLLEIRLNELEDVVDVFALTEATLTFSGKPKPLFFNDNKERFKQFNIAHTIISDCDILRPGPMEVKQKQHGIDFVINNLFSAGDVMILSDCDEIPRASSVKAALKDEWKVATPEMPLFYYYMNCEATGDRTPWRRARLLRPDGWFKYDRTRRMKSDKKYDDAGWHFSFLDDIKYKLESYNHAPLYNRPPFNMAEHIERCKASGEDLFMRKGKRSLEFKYLDDLSYLPQYVLDNMDRFGKYIRR